MKSKRKLYVYIAFVISLIVLFGILLGGTIIDSRPISYFGRLSWNPKTNTIAATGTYRLTIFTQTLELIKSVDLSYTSLTSVAWSPDGDKLATTSGDDQLRIWDAQKLEILYMTGRASGNVAWSPDGLKIAAGISNDQKAHVWNNRLEPITMSQKHADFVSEVKWNRDGSELMTSDWDGNVYIWNGETGEMVRDFHLQEKSRITALALNHDGTRLASALDDKSVEVWDVVTGELITSFANGDDFYPSYVLVWSPDGQLLAGTSSTTFRIWNPTTGQQVTAFVGHDERLVDSIAWSPDGSRIVSGGKDNTIRTWDAFTGQQLNVFKVEDSSF